ncbi:dTDP-4-dehydrorhamnose reductase [Mariniblastus fucicola]|uniref:dTDP-4-dehydrorhamnose reductase n=2 Tax=Mariniblastus fucicola TaxID=980251 RepID=A0A5B9P9B4_9BACT|nr:dTDP-4-dehydrorhamnose reductase [Mariniblastus fucicola]
MMVCGIAGVSGYNAFHWFRDRYGDQVIGQRPRRNWNLTGDGIVGHDLSEVDQIREVLATNNVRTVINCGGSCALKACECDPEMAQQLNVTNVSHLLDVIEGTDIRLVHLSIDLVYSGAGQGGHIETDPTDPVTVYGRTMVEAEQLVMDRRPDSCILRISLPMGISFNGHAGAIDWIQNRFAKGRPATLYFDEVRTPTFVECLNEVVEEVAVSDMSGIFHCGGPRRLSLYEIAQIVNRVGGYDPELLIGCPRIEAGPMPPRAGDVTMDSSRLANALGRDPFAPWPHCDSMVPTDRNWHYERASGAEFLTDGSLEWIERVLYRRSFAHPRR